MKEAKKEGSRGREKVSRRKKGRKSSTEVRKEVKQGRNKRSKEGRKPSKEGKKEVKEV